ncbi:MAG TPA: MmcQ/YjbR family DNA-binding protein [Rhizomicrobium sp.]|nr:MmcQ/YjbR family DNA-binding protein [Rhizomicrobium sp.]
MATLKQAFSHLRKFALAYPETREDHPWGESAFKVRSKVFVIANVTEEGLHVTVKLPRSQEFALEMHSFAEPTGYGLGRSGWITAWFGPKDKPPLDILEAWIDESFHAVAPKKLLKAMEMKESGATSSRPAPKSPRHAAKSRRASRSRRA